MMQRNVFVCAMLTVQSTRTSILWLSVPVSRRRFRSLSSVGILCRLVVAEDDLAVTLDFGNGLVLDNIARQICIIRPSFISSTFFVEQSKRDAAWFEYLKDSRNNFFVGGERYVGLEASVTAMRLWGDMDGVVHVTIETIHRISARRKVEFVAN